MGNSKPPVPLGTKPAQGKGEGNGTTRGETTITVLTGTNDQGEPHSSTLYDSTPKTPRFRSGIASLATNIRTQQNGEANGAKPGTLIMSTTTLSAPYDSNRQLTSNGTPHINSVQKVDSRYLPPPQKK